MGRRKAGNGARAWLILSHVEAYERAWQTHAGPVVREEGPFRIRVQTVADLKASAFDLMAWENPLRPAGRGTPFWVGPATVEATIEPGAPPLVPLVSAGGGSVEGLRLLDGRLVLRIECGSAAIQLLLWGTAPFPKDGGIEIRHRFGLRMPHSVRRMLEFWDVAGLPAPRNGRGRGARIAHC